MNHTEMHADQSDHAVPSHTHDIHEGHSPALFRQKFWLALALTIPIVLYSTTIQHLLGFSMPEFPGSVWLPVLLGTVIFRYGGLVFLKAARHEIVHRQLGMMTLISLAITVAYIYSFAVTFRFVEGMDFWWELATLITIMLLGHWLEMASVANAQSALHELAKLLPDEAELVNDDVHTRVAVADLRVGDHVLVRPGAQVPADGEVIRGSSDVDESMITGESKPVKKLIGSLVVAGTISGGGAITVRITKTGDDTALAGIMKLVAEAQSSKTGTQILADEAAFGLTFVALSAAVVTGAVWAFSGASIGFIMERVVTVLVIACPHALGLAIPLVVAISATRAAKNGLLIRQRLALESLHKVNIILFDKTGTLTTGEQGVVDVVCDVIHPDQLLIRAASIENESEHPIARSIVDSTQKQKMPLLKVTDFKSLAGRGVRAIVDGKMIYVGGPTLVEDLHAVTPDPIGNAADSASKEGKTVSYVIEQNTVIGAIMLADVIRPESKQAVKELHDMGKRVAILTGDSNGVAGWVASQLGIKEFFAEVLPENKAATVKQLQDDGNRVAMVGDGVNDAPALAQADVGIAIGAGTDVAIESAAIILVSSDPRGVAKAIRLSRGTYQKMLQNLAWATGYNVLALPLAAGASTALGFVMSPAVGAVLMSLSTIIVAINAQLLRRIKL